jgi:hypothetical protein
MPTKQTLWLRHKKRVKGVVTLYNGVFAQIRQEYEDARSALWLKHKAGSLSWDDYVSEAQKAMNTYIDKHAPLRAAHDEVVAKSLQAYEADLLKEFL